VGLIGILIGISIPIERPLLHDDIRVPISITSWWWLSACR